MNSKSVYILTALSVLVVGIAVAMVAIFCIKQPYTPSEDVLSFDEGLSNEDIESLPNIVGGSVSEGEVQTTSGMYFKDLTAVADEGYVFAYWVNGTSKICGDKTITVRATSTSGLATTVSACTPVFFLEENVGYIDNATDFASFVTAVASDATDGMLFKLTADINVPTLTSSLGVFRGVFDGNNHAISGFNLNGSGLFSSINGGVVKNLILSDCEISSSQATFVGSFAGSINDGLVSRCLSYADVKNTVVGGRAGGIVGVCSSTDVRSMLFSCGFYGTLSAESAQQQIAQNGTIEGTTTESCAVFRPKNEGAISIS